MDIAPHYRRYCYGVARCNHYIKRKGDDMMKNIRINKETGIRLSVLILALINQALVIFGISPIPFTSAEIEAGVSIVFSVIATLIATWKNNDFTPEAHRATRSEGRR